MKKAIHEICTKLAACALVAASVSADTASFNGMYEPKMPESLRK